MVRTGTHMYSVRVELTLDILLVSGQQLSKYDMFYVRKCIGVPACQIIADIKV